MELAFKSMDGSEFIKMKIDRKSKRWWGTSSQTNYLEQELSWNGLFDKGKEEQQDKLMEKMDDKEFSEVLITQMGINGYKLVDKSGIG